MRRFMLTGGVLAALALPASAASKLETEVNGYLTALAPGAPSCLTDGMALLKITQQKAFASLPEEMRADALMAILSCQPGTRVYGPVAAQLEPIARTPRQAQLANYYLILQNFRDKAYASAADRFVRLEQLQPDLIGRYSRDFLDEMTENPKGDNARRKAVLKALTSHAWPTDSWSSASKAAQAQTVWALDYAETLLNDGDLAGAKAALGSSPEPWAIAAMKQTPVFAPLLAQLEADGRLDTVASAKAALARVDALAAKFPQYLEPHIEAMDYMLALDQGEQALVRGNALIARVDGGEDFLDLASQHAWLLDYLADVYEDLGRDEEGLAMRKRAVASPYSNGSHALNLAATQLDMGRMQDALTTLDKVERGMTPYGEMVRNYIAACAAAKLNPRRARTALGYLRTHWEDSPRHFVDGLVCHGRTNDEADAELQTLRAGKSPKL